MIDREISSQGSPHMAAVQRFFVVPLTQGVPLLWTAKIENPTQSLCRTAKVKILHGDIFYATFFSKKSIFPNT